MSTEKNDKPIVVLTPEVGKKEGKKEKKKPICTSLTWNCTGKKLFAGYNDGLIRVWHVKEN